MAIQNAASIRFTPRGLVDSYDATDLFPGACTSLQNLVFDQINREFVVNRPGVLTLASFVTAGFSAPGFISIHISIGTRIYGMIASGLNAGHDQPFCYESATGLFITITGITAANTPTSPSTIGDWTPPTMANIGTMIAVTHPGFNGIGSNFYGVIDITNPAAPTWRDENTLTNLLPSVPLAVANFNNRAWFACLNTVVFTDVLTNPFTITNASQAITVGDSQNINALAGLPNQTTSSGIVQSLTVFKKTQIWQITGDFAQANLFQNFLSLTIGTQSPRSVVQAPFGLYFISSGGPYMINLLGAVLPVTHDQQGTEPDILIAFQNAVTPTRWAGGYSSTMYRVCGPTVVQGVQVVNDYWFDEHRRRWNGPHTFAYDCASALANTFVLSSALNPAQLIQSSPQPTPGWPVTDLGVQQNFDMQSSTFPKSADQRVKQSVESQIELGTPQGQLTFTIVAENEAGNQIGITTITAGTPPPVWGTMIWGSFIWTSAFAALIPKTYPVYFAAPLVFEKMQLSITGTITANLGIGTFFTRAQKTGYSTTGLQ